MIVLLPKMAMVSDCGGGGIAAVCVERKRRFRHVRLHYIQCFQVISIHYSSATNSNSYFLFLLPPPPAFGSECVLHILLLLLHLILLLPFSLSIPLLSLPKRAGAGSGCRKGRHLHQPALLKLVPVQMPVLAVLPLVLEEQAW